MLSEPLETALVLILLVLIFISFLRERIPADLTALIAVALLLATGVLETNELLGVFSNSAPFTVAAMFVLSAALERTGAIGWIGGRLTEHPGLSLGLAIAAMMFLVMLLSAFMNNTPVVVIFIPVVVQLSRSLGVSPSKLLIPLSFAAILGGTTTLIGTSTNIIVDGVARSRGLEPFGMFEITGAGLVFGLVGVLYFVTIGFRLLPDRDTLATLLPSRSDRHFLTEVLVPIDSPLVGRRLEQAGLTSQRGFVPVDVVRNDLSLRRRLDDLVIAGGDRLVLRSKMSDMLALREAGDVLFSGGEEVHAFEPIAARETILLEGVVGPRSRFIGMAVSELRLRRDYNCYVLAVHRQGESLGDNLDGIHLEQGDTLLVEGPFGGMSRLFDGQDLINLVEPTERAARPQKAPIALGAIALVMVLAAFEVMPIAGLAMIAATAVVAAGCIDTEEAYASVRWNILMLIFAMLAVGEAMEKTGAMALIVNLLAGPLMVLGPHVVLSALYLLTSALTEIVSNNATAILVTPIALGLAEQLGVDPRPFVVAVMFAASASFATPIGYQTNALVYNAGGYRFSDFLRVGLPLNLLLWLTASFIIPLFWPIEVLSH